MILRIPGEPEIPLDEDFWAKAKMKTMTFHTGPLSGLTFAVWYIDDTAILYEDTPIETTSDRTRELFDIALKYFQEHPEERDGVNKAYYAYHVKHFRLDPQAHDFDAHHPWRQQPCKWCGRTRELVRWDNLPATCQKRPEMPSIEATIKAEEYMFFRLLDGAEKKIKKLLGDRPINGETLAILQHTHGFDPSVVELALDIEIPEKVMEDYQRHMAIHRERSKG